MFAVYVVLATAINNIIQYYDSPPYRLNQQEIHTMGVYFTMVYVIGHRITINGLHNIIAL